MTLSNFKKSLKVGTIAFVLVAYGLVSYQIGKLQKIPDILKVKGTSTQREIESPVDSPIPFADTQTQTITASFVRLCSNTTYAFELSYPKDWFTTYNSEDQRCLYFAPYSFVLPQDVSDFNSPIEIEVIKFEDWQTASKFWENPNDSVNILSAENTQVGNFFSKKIEAQATGTGQIPQGFTKTTYLVFTSTNPLAVSYTQLDEKEDAKVAKQVLEEMVKSLKFL